MAPTAFAELASADFVVDATFEGGTAGTMADDPLARLLPVGNQGGFRYRGSPPTPNLVVLLSTRRQAAWPDDLDPYTGLYSYYGDNRTAGHELHDTRRRGNSILADAFRRAHSTNTDRAGSPTFLVFHSTGVRRDVRFLGLAVPGGRALTADDDLVAVWRR